MLNCKLQKLVYFFHSNFTGAVICFVKTYINIYFDKRLNIDRIFEDESIFEKILTYFLVFKKDYKKNWKKLEDEIKKKYPEIDWQDFYFALVDCKNALLGSKDLTLSKIKNHIPWFFHYKPSCKYYIPFPKDLGVSNNFCHYYSLFLNLNRYIYDFLNDTFHHPFIVCWWLNRYSRGPIKSDEDIVNAIDCLQQINRATTEKYIDLIFGTKDFRTMSSQIFRRVNSLFFGKIEKIEEPNNLYKKRLLDIKYPGLTISFEDKLHRHDEWLNNTIKMQDSEIKSLICSLILKEHMIYQKISNDVFLNTSFAVSIIANSQEIYRIEKQNISYSFDKKMKGNLFSFIRHYHEQCKKLCQMKEHIIEISNIADYFEMMKYQNHIKIRVLNVDLLQKSVHQVLQQPSLIYYFTRQVVEQNENCKKIAESLQEEIEKDHYFQLPLVASWKNQIDSKCFYFLKLPNYDLKNSDLISCSEVMGLQMFSNIYCRNSYFEYLRDFPEHTASKILFIKFYNIFCLMRKKNIINPQTNVDPRLLERIYNDIYKIVIANLNNIDVFQGMKYKKKLLGMISTTLTKATFHINTRIVR